MGLYLSHGLLLWFLQCSPDKPASCNLRVQLDLKKAWAMIYCSKLDNSDWSYMVTWLVHCIMVLDIVNETILYRRVPKLDFHMVIVWRWQHLVRDSRQAGNRGRCRASSKTEQTMDHELWRCKNDENWTGVEPDVFLLIQKPKTY